MAKSPLLLIHGMWARPQLWRHMEGIFGQAGYDVINPPLPFHDVTPEDPVPEGLGDASLHDYVGFLEDVAKGLDQTPIVIGHSMGSLVAQLLAQKIQPPKLVLLSPAPSAGMFALYPSIIRTMAGIIFKWGFWHSPTLISEDAARYGIFNAVPEPEATNEINALIHDSGRVLHEMSNWFLDPTHAAKVDYEKLSMPTFIRVGGEDRVTPPGIARQTARRIKGPLDYAEIPGHGHWIVGEVMGPRVAQDIVSWLDT